MVSCGCWEGLHNNVVEAESAFVCYNLRMNVSVGIIGLPNVGPIQNLPSPEGYVLASKGRLYGAALALLEILKSGGLN